MSLQTRKYRYDFRGALAVPTSADGSPWVKTDTSSSGSPTVGGIAGGGIRLALDTTAEVQNLCLSFGDVLAFDINDLISFEIIAKTVAEVDPDVQFAFGLAGARNDAIDSIAQAALFRCVGSNSVVVETDDGTNDNNDVATGLTLGTTWKRFSMNFAERVSTMEPPSVSLGSGSNIGFYGANDNGSSRRVASGTRFDMSNYSGGLQPFIQLQKAVDASNNSLDILEVCVEVKLPSFA